MWYVLSVTIGTDYFLLCYDTKLQGWYKFSINKADCLARKGYGDDTGKLLIGGILYVAFYDETITRDVDAGSIQNISVELQTKDYTFPDNFITARLLWLYLNYLRLGGTNTNTVIFTLRDSSSGQSAAYSDDNDNKHQDISRLAVSEMLGGMIRSRKLNFNIYGQAISKFYAARLDYNVENYGSTWMNYPKANGIVGGGSDHGGGGGGGGGVTPPGPGDNVDGLGMDSGTKAGHQL